MEPRDEIIQFFVEQGASSDGIDDDTDLLGNRILDSLHFLDFVFLIEEVTGREVDLGTLDVEDFRTMTRILNRFFLDPKLVEVTE
jgi:acyl carrier protein